MFFDRPDSGELAVLVHLEFSASHPKIEVCGDPAARESPRSKSVHLQSNSLREFEELVLSAGGDPVDVLIAKRSTPQAKYFIGTGKLEELVQLVTHHQAGLVIFNHELSPSQERNLEQVLGCRVLDRTGLILDIFAQRARTHEGKLQVELAQLQHMSTRLIRGWTHLERQKGGIGMRGPGETQLETDRRLLRERIKAIHKRLDKVRKQRQQGRRSRARAALSTLALVGYTNAGKSTLFNSLSSADVYVQNQLFATLDPTMRRIELPEVGSVVLSDTVGFISHLPHRLVEAFRATLEEAACADMLIHVVDAADPERASNMQAVDEVLEEIGAHELPRITVYNKIDLLCDRSPSIERDERGQISAVWLSAAFGGGDKADVDNSQNVGMTLLRQAIAERLAQTVVHIHLLLAPQRGSLRARFHRQNAILAEHYHSDGVCEVEIRLPEADLERILSAENVLLDDLRWRPVGEDFFGGSLDA